MSPNNPSVWHPKPSKFEPTKLPDGCLPVREGDSLRRLLEGKRILECGVTEGESLDD